jgi:hypothetical protein
VDQSDLSALLTEIDTLADGTLPVDEIIELADSTPMDEELQDRFAIRFHGTNEEILIHVWREQMDWVHLYFSSTSVELIATIESKMKPYARPE